MSRVIHFDIFRFTFWSSFCLGIFAFHRRFFRSVLSVLRLEADDLTSYLTSHWRKNKHISTQYKSSIYWFLFSDCLLFVLHDLSLSVQSFSLLYLCKLNDNTQLPWAWSQVPMTMNITYIYATFGLLQTQPANKTLCGVAIFINFCLQSKSNHKKNCSLFLDEATKRSVEMLQCKVWICARISALWVCFMNRS